MESKVTFQYFYGTQADQYSFYRIPKVLFQDEISAIFPVMQKSL